ncbi:MAG: hypothetical protein K2G24_10985 [Muribaculaceae bacterium]|nr:hypothetical protein [Muribaculaceae bacterium]
MKASEFPYRLALMAKSLVKIVLQSRPVSIREQSGQCHDSITILANGPSLADTIREHGHELASSTCMAVNFAANAPEFTSLHPRYYILADPHFFTKTSDSNVKKLYSAFSSVGWSMTLLVPRQYRKTAKSLVDNPNIRIETFNFIGLEGPAFFEHACYNLRLGMPRPRNVLIPALMCAIWLGYKNISIAGADHSWLRSIWVNDNNEVVSVQPHFYKEDKKEENRIRSEYTNYRLHQILYSFHVAFKSYFNVRRFADKKGVRIINITPGSYIDAFERGE